jgi:hypothetical protein
MPKLARDLTGERFGRLTVMSRYGKTVYPRKWRCRCECGNEIIAAGPDLRCGDTASCGCLRRDTTAKRSTTHGHTVGQAAGRQRSSAYQCWTNMLTRCGNPKAKAYHLYGGASIRVCERWLVFANFLIDMGEPTPGQTLGRLDPTRGFEPGNCTWGPRQPPGRRPGSPWKKPREAD